MSAWAQEDAHRAAVRERRAHMTEAERARERAAVEARCDAWDQTVSPRLLANRAAVANAAADAESAVDRARAPGSGVSSSTRARLRREREEARAHLAALDALLEDPSGRNRRYAAAVAAGVRDHTFTQAFVDQVHSAYSSCVTIRSAEAMASILHSSGMDGSSERRGPPASDSELAGDGGGD